MFIGPNDLGFSMGQLPGEHDEQHAAACQRVADVARAANKVAGIYSGADPADALRYVAQGFNFCPIASDVGLVRDGAVAAIERFRQG